MIRRISIVLLSVAALTATAENLDPKKQNEDYQPKPSEQKRVDIKRAKTPEARPASSERVDVATVPASSGKNVQPAPLDKKRATIDVTPDRVPTRKPEPARVTTTGSPPEKFDKKFQTTVAEKYQAGITDAEQIKKAKLKPAQNITEPARINRFVYRRNEPVPATSPAGGENPPTAAAPAAGASAGS